MGEPSLEYQLWATVPVLLLKEALIGPLARIRGKCSTDTANN